MYVCRVSADDDADVDANDSGGVSNSNSPDSRNVRNVNNNNGKKDECARERGELYQLAE